MRWLLKLGAMAAIVYLAMVAMLFTTQRSMQYPASARITTVEEARLNGFSDITIETEDGETLRAFWHPPEEGRALVLYFHGNGGSLWNRRDRARILARDGRGVLMVSYRGYSGSTDSPTEAGLHLDALAAYDFAREQVPARRILAYGESLGTGVVTRLAADRELGAIVLDAPFTSTADVAQRIYPFIPVSWLMHDQFRSIDVIDRVEEPMLVMHGRHDQVVPYDFGRALYDAAPGEKHFISFGNSGHVSLFEDGGMEAVGLLLSYLESGQPEAAFARMPRQIGAAP
jgi:fermentation-respiration switch protein FrsA (DUF1100 family)